MVSIIITLRHGDSKRDKIYDWVVKRYKSLFPNYELILETEAEDAPLFYKSAALNRAFRRASGQIILQSDADVFCNKKQIEEAVDSCSKTGWATAYTNFYNLGKLISNSIIRGSAIINPPDFRISNISGYEIAVGYLMAIQRDAWIDYNEKFNGWGWEDVAFRYAMETINGMPYRVKGNLYHLWHPHTVRRQSKESGQLEKNRELFMRYSEARGDKEAMLGLIAEGIVDGQNRD